MSAPHTPGPWAVNPQYISEVDAPNGLTVASCWHEQAAGQAIILRDVNPVSLAESAANARLIAAAPELLAMLEEVAEGHALHSDILDLLDRVKGGAA